MATTETSPAARHMNGKAMLGSFAMTAVFDVGVTIVVYQWAKSAGLSTRWAYVLSGVGPLLMMGITWVRARRLSGASLIILVWVLLSAAAAFIGGGDERLLLVKDSAITGGFGVACLVSLLLPKPMMFFFGAKFATDGTRAGLDYWYGLWQYPQFRATQYRINNVWGVAFILEAVVRIVLAYTIDFDTAFTVASIMPFVVLAGLITYTITLGKKAQRAGDARRAALEQA